MAVGDQKEQGAVRTNVSELQSKASANVAKDLRRETSATSLQLALEDNDLQNMVGEYRDVISPAFENNPDAVGFAFAVNGKISTVEWFASPALFGRMRDKLLESAANEAFSNYDKELGFGVPNKLAFDSFVLKALNAPCTGTSENEAVTEKKFETGKIVMFQSFNTGVSSEVPLHITIYSTDDIAQNPQGRNQNQHINNRSISNLMIE